MDSGSTGTTAVGESSTRPELAEVTRDLFLEPAEFGPGYRASAQYPDGYIGPGTTDGSAEPQFAIAAIDDSCRPETWTQVVPLGRGFRWFDVPDGGKRSEELFLYSSEADAQSLLDSARLTLGAAINDPSCGKRNLTAVHRGDLPGSYELRYPVTETDPHCGLGPAADGCHAVVTELAPCVTGADGVEACTPVTQVFARVGRVLVSIVYYAPEGQRTSAPIADLVPAATRVVELVVAHR